MNCWQVVDDLKAVYHCERLYKDENEMQNALIGLFTLYQIKFEELFATYEKLIQEEKILFFKGFFPNCQPPTDNRQPITDNSQLSHVL